MLVCFKASSPTFFWEILIFAYLAVLQIIGLVLAFQTRKVKLQGLKDSKFVAAIIYISSIILMALALVTFSLRTYINIGTGISVFGIFLLTTIFLALIFIPKVRMMHTVWWVALVSYNFGEMALLRYVLAKFKLNSAI